MKNPAKIEYSRCHHQKKLSAMNLGRQPKETDGSKNDRTSFSFFSTGIQHHVDKSHAGCG